MIKSVLLHSADRQPGNLFRFLPVVLTLLLATPAVAQDIPQFTTGPVFTDFGPVADVDYDMTIPADAHFRVAFDVTAQAEQGEVNRALTSAARFINMHVRAGVPEERVQVALVIHGPAGNDVLSAEAYAARFDGAENANLPVIAALLDHGVQIIICGQSATGMGIAKADLAPGVQMALSAMTAHALLQQQGYTLNPF
ncbi:DsrE family protein [Alteraurantiacibacter aquimixticola]|uniref:Uncharacterized protein n=1 Tax=Alteraurantiacibacter aquimixticola TaxID=2489173 RepID=A0A4T3F2X2_9SPHN|nr:DsrE family protein [Alteraurantiacibacter aquimixticola]TIX51071.1 hypothetical protein E5222_00875 [Alteraurantiacibacter aquimixticola]